MRPLRLQARRDLDLNPSPSIRMLASPDKKPSFKLLRDMFDVGLKKHALSKTPFYATKSKADYHMSCLSGMSLTKNNVFHDTANKIADKLKFDTFGALTVKTFAMTDETKGYTIYVTYDTMGGALRFEREDFKPSSMVLSETELPDETEARVFGSVSFIKTNRTYNWVGTPMKQVRAQMENAVKTVHPSLRYGRDWEYSGAIGDAGDIYITKVDKTFLGGNGLPLMLAYLDLI